MLERAWRRVSSLRPERIWLPWRRIMRRLASTLWMLKLALVMNTEWIENDHGS